MFYFIFGGVAALLGTRILDPKYRVFGILMLGVFFLLLTLVWLQAPGSIGFSGVWTPAFGFFLLYMIVAGFVGLCLGILMRYPKVHDVRAD